MSPPRYTCRVSGNALEPRFGDGEYLLVMPDHEPAPGDEVLVVLTTGLRLIRELVATAAGQVTVRPIGGGTTETLSPDVIESVDYIGGRACHYTLGFANRPEVRV